MTHGMTHIYFRELSCVKEGVLNPSVGRVVYFFFWGGSFLFLPHPSPPSHSLRLFWVARLFDFSVSLLLCISAYRCLVMGLQGLGRVAREAGSWRGEGFILSKNGSGDCIFLQTDIIDSVLV